MSQDGYSRCMCHANFFDAVITLGIGSITNALNAP